jgi:hypothetical protein
VISYTHSFCAAGVEGLQKRSLEGQIFVGDISLCRVHLRFDQVQG